jgi:hypothetical protein
VNDDDVEIPQPPAEAVNPHQFEQMQVLLEQFVARMVTLETRVAQVATNNRPSPQPECDDGEAASWVLYPPPALTGDPYADASAFVDYYNTVYIGRSDGRAQRIPSCWEEHRGLAMEIANLAATWHAANTGPSANPREAQWWHHQWRPGTIDRMIRDWLHPDCLDGQHRQ